MLAVRTPLGRLGWAQDAPLHPRHRHRHFQATTILPPEPTIPSVGSLPARPRRQEAFFQYMFGVNDLEGCLGALDLRTTRSFLFVPRLPESYAVWMGHILSPAELQVGTGGWVGARSHASPLLHTSPSLCSYFSFSCCPMFAGCCNVRRPSTLWMRCGTSMRWRRYCLSWHRPACTYWMAASTPTG